MNNFNPIYLLVSGILALLAGFFVKYLFFGSLPYELFVSDAVFSLIGFPLVLLGSFSLYRKFQSLKVFQELARETSKADSEALRTYSAIAQRTQMLAHDVRKPFSLIQMAVDQLSSESDPVMIREIVRKFRPVLDKAMASADRMIADVMELGHESELVLEEMGPDFLVESCVHGIFNVKDDCNVSINYQFKHKNLVKADSVKILRVMQNILENALDAMKNKGAVWFETEDVLVDGVSFVEFVIGNSGPSIPESEFEKLFDPFFTKAKKGGTGLGLAIAEKIIRSHGGTIWCESKQGLGTAFKFRLPSSEELVKKRVKNLPAHSGEVRFAFEASFDQDLLKNATQGIDPKNISKKVASRARKYGRKIKILLIDDQPVYMTALNAKLMGALSVDAEIEVFMASTPTEAISIARVELPQLIICDVDMGADCIDGYEIVKRIRSFCLSSKICMHSNKKSPGEFEQAKRAGADGFLPKPMSKQSLLVLLLAALPEPKRTKKRKHSKKIESKVSKISSATAEVVLVEDCPFTLESWVRKLEDIKTYPFSCPKDFWDFCDQDSGFLARISCVITDQYFDSLDSETGTDLANKLKRISDTPVYISSETDVDCPNAAGSLAKQPLDWWELKKILLQTGLF